MEALCQDLDRILHGESGVDLDAYDEGPGPFSTASSPSS